MSNEKQAVAGSSAFGDNAGVAAAVGTAATPPFDAARYWSYLDSVEASDAEKTALLEALWAVMAQFVEIGFGIDPVQTVIPALVHAAMNESEESAGRPAAKSEGQDVRQRFGASARTTPSNNDPRRDKP